MYKLINNYFKHEDERGSITGLIDFGNWQEMNLITSKSGSIRGGHYHELTEELFYILEGTIKIKLENINTKEKSTIIANTNDVLLIQPNVIHTFEMLTDSKWINLLSIKNNTKQPDIYKITPNL